MRQQSVRGSALAGLFAGLAASWVMNRFQSALSAAEQRFEKEQPSGSNQQEEEPATAKAAARITRPLLGRELAHGEKKIAEPAVHYAMGALSGAAYGAAACMTPLAGAGGGTLFGVVLWLIADETLVPALHVSKSPAEYPPKTHLNALATHLVYGVSTHLLYRGILEAGQDNHRAIRKAAILGILSGLRSMAGPYFLSRSGARLLGSRTANRVLAAAATGELFADKLPQIPNRIKPLPLSFRAASGATCGAIVFAGEHRAPAAGALLGAAAAAAGSFGGYYLRREAVRLGVPSLPAALGEDALTVATGLAVSGLKPR